MTKKGISGRHELNVRVGERQAEERQPQRLTDDQTEA